MDRVIAESVGRLLHALRTVQDDEIPTMLRLLEQRKQWIETELAMERLLDSSPLPPFPELISAEYLLKPESELVPKYQRLLESIDNAMNVLRCRMENRNRAPETS